MGKRFLKEACVNDFEKRRHPSKHYVYVINLMWDNGSLSLIRRRYSEFFKLQMSLINTFPHEAGSNPNSKRIIPFLPGKILFRRSHVRNVALARVLPISEYVQSIVSLPSHISQSDAVLNFFEPTSVDIACSSKFKKSDIVTAVDISKPFHLEQYIAIANFDKSSSNELCLETGQVVEVVDKSESGWWLVLFNGTRGFVPSTYLMKAGCEPDEAIKIYGSLKEARYICCKDYISENADEISINKGCIVEVSEKPLDGWWLVKYRGKKGRFPATNLSRSDTLTANCLLRKCNILEKNEPIRQKFENDERYTAIDDYRNSMVDGIELMKGALVDVVEKDDSGWWYVKSDIDEGWFPSSFLEKRRKPPIPPKPRHKPALPPKPNYRSAN